MNPYNKIKARKGSCIPKQNATYFQPKNILVLNYENGKSRTSTDEVFTDLMSAYFEAFSYASKYHSTHINIFLETGEHYILKSHIENLLILKNKNKEADFTNPQFSLLIKPL